MGLTGLNSRYKQCQFLSEGCRAESVLLPVQLFEATNIPWLMTPFHLPSQQWLVFLTSYHSGTLFCLLSFMRTFVILSGLHDYSGIISSLEGQVISRFNSIHNLNSPMLRNKFTGSRDRNVAIFVGDRGGVTSFWLLQLFITHWVPLSLRATSSLH